MLLVAVVTDLVALLSQHSSEFRLRLRIIPDQLLRRLSARRHRLICLPVWLHHPIRLVILARLVILGVEVLALIIHSNNVIVHVLRLSLGSISCLCEVNRVFQMIVVLMFLDYAHLELGQHHLLQF